MIELQMVHRMMRRAAILAPIVAAALTWFRGSLWGLSAAIGIVMTVLNLWLAARIIGGVAQNNPQLLLVAALGAFTLGLMVLVGIALGLRAAGVVYFPVTGFTLIGSHLVLVLWEASGAYGEATTGRTPDRPMTHVRS
ncbi:MAG: hypothetical protein ABR575_05435 [Actinomycetota bacterium]